MASDLDAARARHAIVYVTLDKNVGRQDCCGSCWVPWPCDFALAIAALDDSVADRDERESRRIDAEYDLVIRLLAARALADELRTYARHDPMCNYRPSYPDGPIATCDCGFDDALAKWEASK